jgi:hypothetical protein
MKAKKIEIRVRHAGELVPVRIVADAVFSTRGRHGGRMLPVLLLDTSDRPDLAEFIRVHQSIEPGDVKTQWGQLEGHEGTVALFLNFIRPMELFVVLEFDIVRQGILVAQTLTGYGLYLTQAEDENYRLMYNPDRPSVVVEVPDTGFAKIWDDLFHKNLAKHYRSKGLSRSDSRRAARSTIAELREIGALRLRDIHIK